MRRAKATASVHKQKQVESWRAMRTGKTGIKLGEYITVTKLDYKPSFLINSCVVNTLTDDCFLNNLSSDQTEQFSFSAKAKKSISSRNSLKSFLEKSFARDITFLNWFLYSFNGINFTYDCNTDNAVSSPLFVRFDFDNSSSEYLFSSSKECVGDMSSNDLFNRISFLVNDSFLKKENKILVSTTSFTQTNPLDFISLNLPFLTFFDSLNISLSVSLLFFNSLSNSCNASCLFIFDMNSSLANSDQLIQGKLDSLDFNSSSTANVILAIYNSPRLLSSSSFSSFLIIPDLATSAQFISGRDFFSFANNSSGIDIVILGIISPQSIYFNTSNYVDVYKCFGFDYENNTFRISCPHFVNCAEATACMHKKIG